MSEIRAIDLFCGAGGSSWGARLAGARIVAGFDHWELAGEVYKENFPEADFVLGRLEDQDPERLREQLSPIDLILASPECTNHSPAKGSQPRCEQSRETAFQVTRYAEVLQPRWIVVENVVSMRRWSRYDDFLACLEGLGYRVKPQVLQADLFGVPTSRRRVFILCDRESEPNAVTPPRSVAAKVARDVVDLNATYKWSLLRTARRATATIERAERGLAALGPDEPFLLVYYGSDAAGGWQALDVPLRTVTTVDRFAIMKPAPQGHIMRMLQVPELKAAMSMPRRFRIRKGTRRDRIRMIGNAVCPRQMKAVVKHLVSGQ